MTIKTGKFKRTEIRTENSPYPSEFRFTKEFNIEEKTFNGKKAKLYQTETTWRNSVMTNRSQYPADTEYAEDRRSWVCDF